MQQMQRKRCTRWEMRVWSESSSVALSRALSRSLYPNTMHAVSANFVCCVRVFLCWFTMRRASVISLQLNELQVHDAKTRKSVWPHRRAMQQRGVSIHPKNIPSAIEPAKSSPHTISCYIPRQKVKETAQNAIPRSHAEPPFSPTRYRSAWKQAGTGGQPTTNSGREIMATAG